MCGDPRQGWRFGRFRNGTPIPLLSCLREAGYADFLGTKIAKI